MAKFSNIWNELQKNIISAERSLCRAGIEMRVHL